MKETEHDTFSRMMDALRIVEDCANKMHAHRPDQDWRAVAATLQLTQAAIYRLAGSGAVSRPTKLLS